MEKSLNNEKSIIRKILSINLIGKLLLLIIVIVLLILLFDFIIMPFYTKHGKEYELPDVTDLPIDEALSVLTEAGFNPIIQDSVYDEQFLQNNVIQQNPLAFSRVKKGRRVYLVVSIGEKPRNVPKLIGLTPQDAEFRLKEQKLILNRVIYEFSDFYHRGVVMNQSIPEGEIVKKNQRINITVSLGPAPTSMEIPNLVGKSLESAEKELDILGVQIGRIKYLYKPNLVPGTVLNQSVSEGTNASEIKSLDLIVSTDEPLPEKNQKDSIIKETENNNHEEQQ
jgi:beta-lactam-binding protein with PASTA domain